MSEFTPREQLEQLLGLDIATVAVTDIHLYGHDHHGALTIALSNGRKLNFDPVHTMGRPQTLIAALAVAANVTPALKQPQCHAALGLACSIATTHAEMTEVEQARSWGLEYLQGGHEVLDVAMSDQRDRWGAWARLANHDPWAAARDAGNSVANHGIVIRDVDGARLVRSGWYLGFVRTVAPRVSHIRLPVLMEQSGWQAPKQFKATNPTRAGETLHWSFYTVPAGWETG